MVSPRGPNATPIIPPLDPGISGEGVDLDPIRSQETALGFDDHLERVRTGRFSERVVGFQNAVKREMMSN